MRSPVSQGALGECNAIRSRGFSRSELTFVGILRSHPFESRVFIAAERRQHLTSTNPLIADR